MKKYPHGRLGCQVRRASRKLVDKPRKNRDSHLFLEHENR